MIVIPRTLTAMTDTQTVIADKVRGVAAEFRLSQGSIAAALGRSRTSVAERMNGRIAWTAPEIFALAQITGQPVDRFFPVAVALAKTA